MSYSKQIKEERELSGDAFLGVEVSWSFGDGKADAVKVSRQKVAEIPKARGAFPVPVCSTPSIFSTLIPPRSLTMRRARIIAFSIVMSSNGYPFRSKITRRKKPLTP